MEPTAPCITRSRNVVQRSLCVYDAPH